MSWRRSRAYEQLMVRMIGVLAVGTTGSLAFLIYARYVGDFEAITFEGMGHKRSDEPPKS